MMLVLVLSLRAGDGWKPEIGRKGTDGLYGLIVKVGNLLAEGEITSTAEVGGLGEE